MLTTVALLVLLGGMAALAGVSAVALDGLERRRLGRIARQVQVTDAIHRALGAIVAPTVAGYRGDPWTVTIGLAPRDFGSAGRLTEIARDTLGQGGADVRIVFVPRPTG
jgi:hypothetical protein